ncbi:carboxylesterase/lipase family protein [Sphingomonas sp.]|uniref:carboxylesterase/lipase family protein n=1 Tax=Sphingomonas sp. TaxID=28214 RepID=UPI003CC5CD17
MSGGEPSRRAVLGGGIAAAAMPRHAHASGWQLAIADAPAGSFAGDFDGDVVRFRGIRYGRAPRFQPPEPIAASRLPIEAQAFGPVAPQPGDRYGPQSEDCLFLNVWTADPDPRARKPVMVYIHGGAYSTGSVTDPLNDGTALAARGDVVVVTVNHRLNAFGYLYLARLDPRFPDSGNLGQLDLILALQWVRDNIAAFGGDPARVTVFGQSGGGAKIATMLAQPAATGLFHRAITMSGQQVTASGPLHATERTRAYMAKLGANSVDDLLAMPVARLVEGLAATDPILGGGLYFGPVLDMRSLARHPFWPDAPPSTVPLMLGNTRQETGAFISPDSDRVKTLSWTNLAERMTPELRVDLSPEWIVAQYRQHFSDWTPQQIFYDATTCGRSWPGQVIEAEARARAGAPAWVYQLDFASRIDPRRGAFHTMDIPLAFGTLGAEGSQTGTGADARAASQALQNRFVAFATHGTPGAGWPRYDLTSRATMLFDTRARVENDPRRWQRELFARAPYIQPGT